MEKSMSLLALTSTRLMLSSAKRSSTLGSNIFRIQIAATYVLPLFEGFGHEAEVLY